MSHLRGFRAYTVDPKWQEALAFDGDLKLEHKPHSMSELRGHFFEMISRENDLVLTNKSLDPFSEEKNAFLLDAGHELCSLITQGAYHFHPEPVFYVYIIESDGRRQLGVLGDLDHHAYDNGVILPHEETLDNKIETIASITKHSGVFNGFPIIFATFEEALVRLLEGIAATTPPVIRIQRDNDLHLVHKATLQQTADIRELVKKIPEAFIADGHHRFKGFSKFIKSLSPQERDAHIPEVASFPVFLVSEQSLQIKKFHRIVTNLHGHTEDQVLEGLSRHFLVSPFDLSDLDPVHPDFHAEVDRRVSPRAPGHFSLYFHESGRWVSAVQLVKVQGNAVESLDVQYLSETFFREILGIPDLRKCSSVLYYPSLVGGSSFVMGHETAKVSVLCHELSLDDVKQVARSGLKMPPKATLFCPKPLLGMLFKMHLRLECGC